MNNQLLKRSEPLPSFSQISDICDSYGIGNLIKIVRQIEDTANVNIEIIAQTGKYVIKIFTCDSKRFDFILDILGKLRVNKLPVLMPLKNKSGSYFLKIGPKILQITKFVYGYPFNYSVKQTMSSGKMLHKFHDTLSYTGSFIKPIASLYPSTDTLQNGINRLKNMDGEIPGKQIDSILGLYDETVGKWETCKPDLPETIIHGDWNQDNLIFSKSEEVCFIMDFEFITKAERLFDIAYALWRLNINQGHMDAARAFMEGYGTLSYEEMQYLPLEICRISYYYICTSALSLNPKNELTNHFKSHYPFIKWVLSNNGQKIIRDLCKQ
ncbi:MAG TPA: phosphotransferase [Bacillota bacterium]|nr:phosphotransferase [Bacillota bacterium]